MSRDELFKLQEAVVCGKSSQTLAECFDSANIDSDLAYEVMAPLHLWADDNLGVNRQLLLNQIRYLMDLAVA